MSCIQHQSMISHSSSSKIGGKNFGSSKDFNLQLYAFHIPGLTNKIPDSLFRYATSRDYSFHQEVFSKAQQALKTHSSIDMFANGQNRKLKWFVSFKVDSWAVGQECLSLPWMGEQPFLHPPFALIQTTLNKVLEKNIQVMIVVPNWSFQHWWPNLTNLASMYVNLGKSVDVLKMDGRLGKAKSIFN